MFRFLTAEWRHLLMVNYDVDPAILRSRVPHGCELDLLDGRAIVSMVGFRFLKTRLLRIPIPGHTDFDEVNLRFYVRRRVDGRWRRGVTFVKELVPRWAIATVARTLYGEKYATVPMRRELTASDDEAPAPGQTLLWTWERDGRTERLGATVGKSIAASDQTEPRFITEHYWGYASLRGTAGTTEYQVEHKPWELWHADDALLHADVATLYGPDFVDPLAAPPSSALVAGGAPVAIRWGSRIPAASTR